MTKTSAALLLGLALAGCATEPPPPVPIQPVSIKAESFCLVMCRIYKATNCYPIWDVNDSQQSIDSTLRLEAAVKRRCTKKTVLAKGTT